ncbi:PspC domain-containing protein [Niallia taxi]|uniref:PspC domain-containing protein n=1 Tax=Niallia taxi TaxID=2499688 RepID=A0A3S2TUK0_9BACI|nr:PspC domain-containing protein [Niallia taxi]MCM3217661.1 PspC domain-containing protein [Niallia taxi]MED4037190.1 PspC domain-containing protein [Niallia taxi]MED4054923.1 PspC domain-containing protein [Niallia taxi]MED4121065.1 PspC domain-containing protein [Niallia taxi]RVT63686.1 PspC domain-containing protein [Niallia taxi]
MKKLVRSTNNRKLAGVIGGLAESINVNANLLRVIFVLALIPTGFSLVLIYLLLTFVLPNEV